MNRTENSYKMLSTLSRRTLSQNMIICSEVCNSTHVESLLGIIHADFNEGNIVVREAHGEKDRRHTNDGDLQSQEATQSDTKSALLNADAANLHDWSSKESNIDSDFEVHAILDFGDSVFEYYVFEVAITMAYMMIESVHMDPIEAGGHTLAGYLSEFPLPKADLNALKECVCGRLAQSFTYGAYEHMLDPSNTYCLTTSKRGWPLLRKLWSTQKKELYKKWSDIVCKYNPDLAKLI